MPFTSTEKMQLLFYLGYSGFEDDGPAIRAINGLDSHEATMRPMIVELLDNLRKVDKEILETIPLASALEDGDIKIRAHYTLNHLRQLGRQYVGRLSRWTKIQVGEDVFSSGTTNSSTFYSGDPSEHRVDNTLGVPTLGT